MRNVDMRNTDGKLVVTIDLAAGTVQSKSGRSDTIATTNGNHVVGVLSDGRPVYLGLNCYAKR